MAYFAAWTNCGTVKNARRVEQIVLFGGVNRAFNSVGYWRYNPSSAVIIYDIASDTWRRGKLSI